MPSTSLICGLGLSLFFVVGSTHLPAHQAPNLRTAKADEVGMSSERLARITVTTCQPLPTTFRFQQMMPNGGELDNERVLGRKAVQMMTTDQVVNRYPEHPAASFVLGYEVVRDSATIPGARVASHRRRPTRKAVSQLFGFQLRE